LSLISGRTALNFLLKNSMSAIPFTIPKIGDMIHSMEVFTFASALDLNMGYYHIKLDADAQKLSNITMSNDKMQI
jgi:hypothetical protein